MALATTSDLPSVACSRWADLIIKLTEHEYKCWTGHLTHAIAGRAELCPFARSMQEEVIVLSFRHFWGVTSSSIFPDIGNEIKSIVALVWYAQ